MGKIDTQKAIKKALQEVPLLSPNASRLIQITSQRDHEMGEVIQLVKHDPILTARLLKIVNSAAFQTLYPITSIDRAVSFLGERMVVSVAIEDSAGKLLDKALDGYECSKGMLWKHDLLAAFAARGVSRHCRGELGAEVAFTGGLLHDIGKSIISDVLHGTSADVVARIEKGEIADYLEAENVLLGCDHTVVGYELAKTWRLPVDLQEAILHHHHPELASAEMRPLVYAVHLGDIISMMAGQGTGSDSMRYSLSSGYEEFFDISKDALPMIMFTAQEEFAKAQSSFDEPSTGEGA